MARAEPAKNVLYFDLRASTQKADESIQQVTLSLKSFVPPSDGRET